MRLQGKRRQSIALGVAMAAVALAGSCSPTATRPPGVEVPLEFALYCDNLDDGGLLATLLIANRGHHSVLLRECVVATASRQVQFPEGSSSFDAAGTGPLWGTCTHLKGSCFVYLPPTDAKIEDLSDLEGVAVKRKFEGGVFLPDREDYPRTTLTLRGHVLVFVLEPEADWREDARVAQEGRYEARYVGFEVTAPFPLTVRSSESR